MRRRLIKQAESFEPDIIEAIQSGKRKYHLGNYKPLDLDSEGIVNMQIVGLNVDTLSDGKENQDGKQS